MVKLVAESFETDNKVLFLHDGCKFLACVATGGCRDRVQDFGKFVNSRSIKWNKKTSKGCTL